MLPQGNLLYSKKNASARVALIPLQLIQLFLHAAMYKKLSILIITAFASIVIHAQADWKLKTDKEGIKVYTKLPEGTKFKAIKIECTMQATLSQLVFAIMDINTCKQWVYNTKTCTLVKQVSPSEVYYYSEVNIPWPVSNRDFVGHLVVSQNAATKMVIINAENVPGFVAEKENVVRVTHSTGKWVITPAGPGLVSIEYTLFTDPAGSVPAWLMNLFITKGPFDSLKKLKEHITKDIDKNLHLSYIQN